jgi:hypothetical protein
MPDVYAAIEIGSAHCAAISSAHGYLAALDLPRLCGAVTKGIAKSNGQVWEDERPDLNDPAVSKPMGYDTGRIALEMRIRRSQFEDH